MSKLRDKAAEIKAEGEAKRGEFIPDGVPKRVYNYWLEESQSDKAKSIRDRSQKENFCHFWRVVAIWAPLLWLGQKLVKSFESTTFNIIAAIVAVIGVIALLGLTGGMEFLLILGLTLLVMALVVAICAGLAALAARYPERMDKFWKVVGSLALAAGVIMILFGIVSVGGIGGIIFIAVGVIAAALIYFNLDHISDFIEGLRERNRRRAAERDAAERKAISDYYDEHGHYPFQKAKREPGRISKFFTGVGDFIILIAQAVRVNKWKICPLVEIDTPKQARYDDDDVWGIV